LNPGAEELIKNQGGRQAFCRYCKSRETCNDDSFPRIIPPVKLILEYFREKLQGYIGFPWPGNFRCQPVWFLDMMKHAEVVYNRTQEEIMEQQYGKNEHKSNG